MYIHIIVCLCAHCTPNKYRLANEKLQNTQIEFTVNESEYCEKWVNKHFQTILNLFYQLAKSIFRHSLCKQQVIYAMLACRNCVKTCLEWRIKKITLTYRKTEKRTNTYHYKWKRGKKRQPKRKRAQKKYWNADIQTMASQAIVMMPQCSNRPVIHRYFSLVVVGCCFCFFFLVYFCCAWWCGVNTRALIQGLKRKHSVEHQCLNPDPLTISTVSKVNTLMRSIYRIHYVGCCTSRHINLTWTPHSQRSFTHSLTPSLSFSIQYLWFVFNLFAMIC